MSMDVYLYRFALMDRPCALSCHQAPPYPFIITLTALSKLATDDILFFFLYYLSVKIRLGVSCETPARQTICLLC